MSAYPILLLETDIDDRLVRIPLAVRMKLDLSACKISLDHWRMLDQEQRHALFSMPAETDADIDAFRTALVAGLAQVGGPSPQNSPHAVSEWKESGPVPHRVRKMLRQGEIELDWSALGRFGRYVIWRIASKADLKELRKAAMEIGGQLP